jgi:hypothetical protein
VRSYQQVVEEGGMDPDRTASLVTGLLYLLGMAAGLLSVAPSVDGRDFMVAVATNRTRVMRAAFCQLAMFPAYIGTAVALYPMLRRHGEGSAFGFAALRITAGAFVLVGVLLLMLLLTVSQKFVEEEDPAGGHWSALGEALRRSRDLVNHVAMVLAIGGGSLLLNALLLRADLAPRWLSGWGLAGAVLAMTASGLVISRRLDVTSAGYIALTLPFAAQELVFATWLVFVGMHG